jgi:Bacterial archaeo-eukaryotic release factor family 3
MNDLLTPQSLEELLLAREPPCLSLYQPTHRRHPENQQDPIRFRNLLKQLEASLRQQYSAAEAQRLLAPLEALAHDQQFWNHTLHGLAVLSANNLFRVFHLQRHVDELAIVADTFHTSPLRRYLQSGGRYLLLGLSLDKIRLLEGTRESLDEITPAAGVPRTIGAALGTELSEPHLTTSSYGGVGGGHMAMHHGHGGKKDEADKDAERFFRAIDSAVLEHHSRPSGLPLILAALPEHHALFRKISHNPYLLPVGLQIHPDAIPIDELRERAWQVVEPQYAARLAELADEFKSAQSHGQGSDDLAAVAEAASAGRVATLIIEADRHMPGRLDTVTGRIERVDLAHPQVDDLLDDLCALVELKGGEVAILPAPLMPGKSGLAATYRY